jgi:hypothetical protein
MPAASGERHAPNGENRQARPMAMRRDSHEALSMRRITAPIRAAAHFYRWIDWQLNKRTIA